MIASLKGVLTSIGKSDIILEVNGIGYLLNVSSKLISSLGDIGSNLSLFTDLQIKDDKIVIYGFVDSSEQSFFKLLQSVQGVGPRAALSLLSTLSVDDVVLAVSSGDKTMLSRAEGIGPKVAGRIASELLDKISIFNMNSSIKDTHNKSNNSEQYKLNLQENDYDGNVSIIVEDTISALINLGYGRSEVFLVVMKIKNDFTNSPETDQMMQSMLQKLNLQNEDIFFDKPKIRVVTHSKYLESGAGYVFKPHRDTWYAGPKSQLNLWFPIFDVDLNSTFAIYPNYWQKKILNSSENFDYDTWKNKFRFTANKHIKTDTRNHPLPLEDLDKSKEFRVDCKA